MKKLITFLLTGFVAFAQSAPSGKVTLAWDYPAAESTNVTFILFHSVDATVPLTNWTVRASIPGTNRLHSITVNPGANYFYLTTSNFWGMSVPSNVAATPPLPGLPQNVSLSRTN